MTDFIIQTSHAVSSYDIADLITGAFENGGSTYWIDFVHQDGDLLNGHQGYSDASVYDSDFCWVIKAEDDDELYLPQPLPHRRGAAADG
jgi:hypothetical protein